MKICNLIEDGKAKLMEISDGSSMPKEAKLDWFDANNLPSKHEDGWGRGVN